MYFMAISRILLLGAACGLVVCGGCKKKTAPTARPPTPVSVATAQQADVPVYLPSFGRLQALNDVNVQPQVSGKILDAPFVEGATVQKGDVLFHIEPDIYKAEVDQAKASLDAAKVALRQKKDTLKRNASLVEQKLISQDNFEQLKTDVDASEASVEQLSAALEQAKINLAYCDVVAPVTGVTGKRLVDPGNIVSPGAGQTLVNVRSVDPLYADFTLSEAYLPEVKAAMKKGEVAVLLVLEENAGHAGVFHGQVKMYDNAVDSKSGTIGLRALVSNPDGALWPGQFVFVYPMLDKIKDAIVVPQSAVALGKNGPYSYVIKDNKADIRLVEKGVDVGDAVVITKGLEAGDVVVTLGQLALWPSAPVAITKTPSAEQAAAVEKKLKDPNIISTIRTMTAAGVTEEEIALFTGVPADQAQQALGKQPSQSTADAKPAAK